MFKFLRVLIIVVVATGAYDFSDSDYNQYLLNEFELLNKDISSARQRRDTKVVSTDKKECVGENKNNFVCCIGDKFDAEYSKQMHVIKRQCALNFRANNSDVENVDPFDCEQMAKIKELIICEGECFARAVNVIDENGQFNREAIIKRFAEHKLGETDWKKDVFVAYIDICIAQAKNQGQENVHKCSRVSMDFHHCIWGKFISGCPVHLRVDSDKCNKMRERYGEGSEAFFNKHLFDAFLLNGPQKKKI